MQASQAPATPRDEDLDEEEEEEDEEDEDEEDDDDSLTAGSQVSRSLTWSSVNQAGFPEGEAWHLLSWRALLARQGRRGHQGELRL